MDLISGARLGPYEITGQIGAGGMGEVYRATDTNLDRPVAIKVLPEAVAADPERLARFDREAKTLAALNHPNIAAIYGLERADGRTALVMEFVEGPTLADRVAQGPIPVDEAILIAKQIAEALEAAHEQGIIHRDLKPANIKLRPDGTVKVLDFGLAKAMEPAGAAASPSASMSPTITTPAMTQAGIILGTAAYMSPEQARGKPVDKRTDIWAFGCVLYEMLTGRRAFAGDDVTVTLARVVEREPDLEALRSVAPPYIAQVLSVCLQKNPAQRVRDMSDVILALTGAFETRSERTVAESSTSRPGPLVPTVVALCVGGLTAAAVAWSVWPMPQPGPVTRTTIPQIAAPLALGARLPVIAISPDGARVAYRVWNADNTDALVVRPLEALDESILYTGRSRFSSLSPFFSPDGTWVGFNDQFDGTIKRVSINGGPAATIVAVSEGRMAGATWTNDDHIIFGTDASSGLWQVPAGGGEPDSLTVLDDDQGELNHEWPDVLPGGEAVVFTVRHGGAADTSEIVLLELTTGERRRLIAGGSHGRYVPTGHLVYGYAGSLWAVPFDPDQGAVTGTPIAVVDRVLTKAQSGAADFAVARDGSLVYVMADAGALQETLVAVSPSGPEEVVASFAGTIGMPRVSPDGTRLALVRNVDNGEDLWIHDRGRDTSQPLTSEQGDERDPVWSQDGQRIGYYAEGGDAEPGLFVRNADGTGQAVRMTTGNHRPLSWSADDSIVYLEFQVGRTEQRGLGVVSVSNPGSPRLVLPVPDIGSAALSPDGRWLAYADLVNGSYDVYVRPFPNVADASVRISTAGGLSPVWAPDGAALYYRQDTSIMKVVRGSGAPGAWSLPEPVVSGAFKFGTPGPRQFDVDSQAERFVMIRGVEDNPGSEPRVVLVRNWFAELERLVPTD